MRAHNVCSVVIANHPSLIGRSTHALQRPFKTSQRWLQMPQFIAGPNCINVLSDATVVYFDVLNFLETIGQNVQWIASTLKLRQHIERPIQ